MTSKAQQIADQLRAQIESGELPPGAPIPAEDNQALWGASRMTARVGIMRLVNEGLIVRKGHGRVVAARERLVVHLARTADLVWAGEAPTAGADAWVGDTRRAGHEPAQRIGIAPCLAEDEIAARLEVAGGGPVWRRSLVRGDSDEPHNLITFWFPDHIAAGTVLAGDASIKEGSVAWLQRNRGPLTHEPPEVIARPPTQAEAHLLKIAGVWVLQVWRTSRSPDGPVMTSRAVYRADRTILKP